MARPLGTPGARSAVPLGLPPRAKGTCAREQSTRGVRAARVAKIVTGVGPAAGPSVPSATVAIRLLKTRARTGLGQGSGAHLSRTPKVDRLEAAVPAKSKREKVTSSGKRERECGEAGEVRGQEQRAMQLAHGGGGCSPDTTLPALTQGAWRRSEPSGWRSAAAPPRGIEPRPPNEHARRGSPAGGSHSACSRAIGHFKLPPTGRI